MILLLVIATVIFDVMIIVAFFWKIIHSILHTKSRVGLIFWGIVLVITCRYSYCFYESVVVEYLESGLDILLYPPVILIMYVIFQKIKGSLRS